ncbi:MULTISPECIES: nucleoside triphosphate pyrophosphohydrolase family protein [unclassified Marinobacter]|uniref:nucleoside triphosphate pyrophosphohydrolase family protein n=1 Tax=unclassified Marinobacter TaxID=83889 RepID=UPI001C12B68E|nr:MULTISPECIES: nucleoside triphosphate pyrophosphohydrolase family protein [unclassified Marinobacter]
MNDYQEKTSATAIYPKDKALEYLTLGLVSEAGEVAGKVKKFLRGDYDELPREDLEKELGDVLWYIAQLCEVMGLAMGDAAYFNLKKLMERKKNNTLQGNGDDR